jgi:hypothetical protein
MVTIEVVICFLRTAVDRLSSLPSHPHSHTRPRRVLEIFSEEIGLVNEGRRQCGPPHAPDFASKKKTAIVTLFSTFFLVSVVHVNPSEIYTTSTTTSQTAGERRDYSQAAFLMGVTTALVWR